MTERAILLVGGGHAHVHVMRALSGRLPQGWRVRLVSPGRFTPYSGMLPGFIAGHYRFEDMHIDLEWLAAETGTEFGQASAIGLDRERRRVLTDDGQEIGYDILSLDIGITPALDAIDGAAENAIAVKPIADFVEKFDGLRNAALSPDGPRRIAVIGGGAGGVELLLSLQTRFSQEGQSRLAFCLVTSGEILSAHNRRVRDAFRKVLGDRGVALREQARVAAVEPGELVLSNGERIEADAVLVTTNAMAAGWLGETGLQLDKGGFVAVGPTLQSLNDPNVLAVGDCASLVETPREKAGVYAVRAGPPLARNLIAMAEGRKPAPWRPQSRHLALISTGKKYAVASRGAFKAEGKWLWSLKDWIDRSWMRQYKA